MLSRTDHEVKGHQLAGFMKYIVSVLLKFLIHSFPIPSGLLSFPFRGHVTLHSLGHHVLQPQSLNTAWPKWTCFARLSDQGPGPIASGIQLTAICSLAIPSPFSSFGFFAEIEGLLDPLEATDMEGEGPSSFKRLSVLWLVSNRSDVQGRIRLTLERYRQRASGRDHQKVIPGPRLVGSRCPRKMEVEGSYLVSISRLRCTQLNVRVVSRLTSGQSIRYPSTATEPKLA